MGAKLKFDKFNRGETVWGVIRYEVLPSRKIIAFNVSGTDLVVLRFGHDIDFDRESDELVNKHRDSKNNLAFEYIPNVGFDEVDTKEQNWFTFD